MPRPEIRPRIFVALQNGLAALLCLALLAAEIVRRLLFLNPESEMLWRLNSLANRSVMPVLRYVEILLPTPDKLLYGLAAGVAITLTAWWTRYWFATAVAGHVTLGALIIITAALFRRGNLAAAAGQLPYAPADVSTGIAGYLLVLLTLFVFVMCLADHLAFLRHLASLRQYLRNRRAERRA